MILSIPSRSGPVIIVTTIIIDHGHWGRVICLPTRGGGSQSQILVMKMRQKFGKYFLWGRGGRGFLMFIIYVKD